MRLKKYTLFAAIIFLGLISIAERSFAQIPPTHKSPSNGQFCQLVNTTFEWSMPLSWEEFTLQISLSEDFSESVTTFQNIADTSFTTVIPRFDTTYYWRVTVELTSGDERTSTPWRFTTTSEPSMSLYPSDDTLCIYRTQDNIEFVWTDMADTYVFEISDEADFSNLVVLRSGLSDTTFTASVGQIPESMTTYYWRVQGFNGTCATDYTEVRTFTTAPAKPILTFPGNNAFGAPLFDLPPYQIRVEWEYDDMADFYQIQIDTLPTFANPIFDSTLIDTNYYDADIDDNYNEIYYWRVRAAYGTCTTLWSEVFSFKTPYPVETPLIPANGRICYPIDADFIWETVADAGKYRIQVAADTNFTNIIFEDADITATSISYMLPETNTKYYWRYRAEDDNNVGVWSEINSFTTAISPPELSSPVNNSGVNMIMPTFRWEDFGENSIYRITIAEDEDFTNVVIDSAGIDTNFIQLGTFDYNSTYYWRVMAEINTCVSAFSPSKMFKTVLDQVELASPADEATGVSITPTFTWEDLDGAIAYDIQLALDSNFTQIIGSKIDHTVSIIIFSGLTLSDTTNYYWRVRGTDEFGRAGWSDFFMFRTGINPPSRPNLISPAFRTTLIPINPTFSWTEVPNTDNYTLRISTNENMTNSQTFDDIPQNSYQASGLDNYTTYFWQVKANNGGGESAWSHIWEFRTIDIAPTQTPILTDPKDGATNIPTIYDFSWLESDRAIYYRIEISTDQNFNENNVEIVFDRIGIPTRNITNMQEATTYYWRVRGWNEAGETNWSQIFSFETIDPTSVFEKMDRPFKSYIYPNPTENQAKLEFQIDTPGKVRIAIYDQLGREIMVAHDSFMNSGNQSIELSFEKVEKGIYIYHITSDNKHESGKIIKD